MSNNPLLKSLKMFNPKSDLEVDESFLTMINTLGKDPLSDLEGGVSGQTEKESVSEFGTIRTGGGIKAGCVSLDLGEGNSVIAAANKKGEIYYFNPSEKGLSVVGKVSLQGSILTSPVFSGGILYCTTREGMIYAVEVTSNRDQPGAAIQNKLIWQKRMKKGILSAPVSTGKVLIVTSLDGIYAFDAFNGENRTIGKPLWGMSLNGSVSTPVIYSGMLFIGTEDKKVISFDYGGSRLKKVWEHSMSGACRTKPCLAVTTGQVVVGTVDGFIYGLDQRNGTYKWNYIVKAPILSNIVSEFINDKEYFFFGADNGVFYCLDHFGKKKWHFKTNGKIRTEALISNGVVYFGSEDNRLYALDINDGREIFNFPTDGNVYGKPLVADDKIYFGSTDSFIHSIKI